MSTWCSLLLACLLASAVRGQYSDDLYDDPSANLLLEELQKRLDDLGGIDDAYFPEYSANFPWYDDAMSAETRDSGSDDVMQEDIREPEHLSHGSQSQGFQYISGGAGEGKQNLKPEGDLENMQEVKSDEGLPFYCHPPNPCPKGFTAADGCHDFIQDSVEEQQTWINKMMEKAMCSCDKEHMFSCPKPSDSSSPDSGANDLPSGDDKIDDILNLMQWQTDKQNGNKDAWTGNDKLNVVAKKAPIIKRSVSNEDVIDAELERMKKAGEWGHNPFLKGPKVSTYAKKG